MYWEIIFEGVFVTIVRVDTWIYIYEICSLFTISNSTFAAHTIAPVCILDFKYILLILTIIIFFTVLFIMSNLKNTRSNVYIFKKNIAFVL